MNDPQKEPWQGGLPFPKRWIGYIALKFIVLALVIYVALRWQGVV